MGSFNENITLTEEEIKIVVDEDYTITLPVTDDLLQILEDNRNEAVAKQDYEMSMHWSKALNVATKEFTQPAVEADEVEWDEDTPENVPTKQAEVWTPAKLMFPNCRAICWTGDNFHHVTDFIDMNNLPYIIRLQKNGRLDIQLQMNGLLKADLGHYIVEFGRFKLRHLMVFRPNQFHSIFKLTPETQ